MDKQPLITILTDTKNRAGFISRCIESIQKQTYQNYEHIIADGGSDNTEEVVMAYNDPHIKYVKVPVGGPVAQTATSFAMSKGEFITFLDDDDEYLPEKLEKQLELMLSLPDEYCFIYGSMSYYDNESKPYLYDHPAIIGGGVDLLKEAISKPLVCGTPTFMFRRKVFEAIGGTWIAGIGNERSDWALGCFALKKGYKVAPLHESYIKVYINHQAQRMSDAGFYKDSAARYKLFHKYFLREYADIIKLYPKSAVTHYESLLVCSINLNEFGEALKWWWLLIKAKLSFRTLASLPYYLCRYGLKR